MPSLSFTPCATSPAAKSRFNIMPRSPTISTLLPWEVTLSDKAFAAFGA
ncbi:hypothetical protein MCHI_002176 [Candidatus Magnetoovum chiemensis]|nr:hypothetical protein MCHI_002176 [Candidatus Magnetoovum chiemensis]